MASKPYLETVRQQYESLPYPPRDPADEYKRLIHNVPASLLAINHHCFAGKRDFRSGFRCLVAGAGTGDSIIFLAEQLRHYDAEVVYLDMSVASRRIAEERARIRRLKNIVWTTASIMELPDLGLGEFDYIECSGVLHHLESSEAGLNALNAVLRSDGAMFLMLYAKYGRQSVYDMQGLLRQYLPDGLGIPEKLHMTRQLLNALPATNSFARDIEAWRPEISEQGFGDVGLYDLLLHSQDRCFDVPGIYALARSAGLHLLSFAVRADAYDPVNHVVDTRVRDHLVTLDLMRRQVLAEALVGDIRMHEFFLARQPGRGASLKDEDNALRSYGALLREAPRVAQAMVPGSSNMIRLADQGRTLDIPCTPVAKVIFAHMDGNTSIRELRQGIMQAVPGATPDAIDHEIAHVYNTLHPRGYLYLVKAGSYGVTVPDYEQLMMTSRPVAG